jgi:hypothetical protein
MDLQDYTNYSPHFALIQGKDEMSTTTIFGRIAQLSEESRTVLSSESTAESLQKLVTSGTVPANYGTALAKIVGLCILGDVAVAHIEQLLLKLNLTPEQAGVVNAVLTDILSSTAPAKNIPAIPPVPLPELPPMSRPTENGPRVVAGPKVPARNIIDLRKQQ